MARMTPASGIAITAVETVKRAEPQVDTTSIPCFA